MSGHWTVCQYGPPRVIRRGGRLLPKGRGWYWIRTWSEWICVVYRPWVGQQVVWRGREMPGAFPGPTVPGLREECDVKKKSAAGGNPDEPHIVAVETEVLRDHMAIVEHCAVTRYDDGSPREPGWITIATRGRSWVVTVKDPDSCCSFRAVGTTLDEALETAQELLACEGAPWEQDAWLARDRASQKKKK